MGIAFSGSRASVRGAAVCLLAFGTFASACSSDPRPPADVAFHSASVPAADVVEPQTTDVYDNVEMAQAYPVPQDPAEAISEPLADPALAAPAQPQVMEPPQVLEPPDVLEPQMSQPAAPAEVIAPQPERRGWFGRTEPQSPSMPAAELACRKQLKRLKVRYVEMDPIYDSASCQIPHPLKVSAIGSVEIKPAATLNCEMAATFAGWTRNELVSSSRWRYMSGIKTIHQGSSYSCRRIRGEGKMSAHSTGSAIDVMAITLNNGKKIDVRKQGFFAFRARGLLNTVRADGCQYFTTVLGPGYNYDHRNHFHFDLMKRRSGKVACH